MDLHQAADLLNTFSAGNLTTRISQLEAKVKNNDVNELDATLSKSEIQADILQAAIVFKQTAGQINVVIHSLGILLSLPYIIEKGEMIEALSLGAGNAGRKYDMETNLRVAEFKFIHWQGGAEAIRQNQLFKDFFLLAENATAKRKCLYVLGKEFPLKFLNGNRAVESVMSKNKNIDKQFHDLYQSRFKTIGEYYSHKREVVEIIDYLEVVPDHISQLFRNLGRKRSGFLIEDM